MAVALVLGSLWVLERSLGQPAALCAVEFVWKRLTLKFWLEKTQFILGSD